MNGSCGFEVENGFEALSLPPRIGRHGVHCCRAAQGKTTPKVGEGGSGLVDIFSGDDRVEILRKDLVADVDLGWARSAHVSFRVEVGVEEENEKQLNDID